MLYCLDTNVYIEAHRRYYAFDIAPGFWEAIADWAANGIVCSPLPVYDEISNSRDQLAEWAKTNQKSLVVTPDEVTVAAYSEIVNLVEKYYEPQHVQVCLNGADPWVVAHAKAYNLVVVTMESIKNEQVNKGTGLTAGKIQIPNLCKRIGVKYINTFDLLRTMKLTLH